MCVPAPDCACVCVTERKCVFSRARKTRGQFFRLMLLTLTKDKRFFSPTWLEKFNVLEQVFLEFDGGTKAEAAGWVVLATHLLGEKMCHEICIKLAVEPFENNKKQLLLSSCKQFLLSSCKQLLLSSCKQLLFSLLLK